MVDPIEWEAVTMEFSKYRDIGRKNETNTIFVGVYKLLLYSIVLLTKVIHIQVY